jgi:hypothetical protein
MGKDNTLNNFGNLASNIFGLQFQWSYQHNRTVKKLYEGKDKTSRFLTSSYASCLVECCRTPLHDLYSAQQSSVPTLQLARN